VGSEAYGSLTFPRKKRHDMNTETAKRPDYKHPKVIEIAAAKIAPRVIAWAESDGELTQGDKERIVEDVARLLDRHGYDLDGFKLARAMESMGLVSEANAGLVDALEHAHWDVSDAIDDVTAEWVAENNITPLFKEGDRVVYVRQGLISPNEMREVEGVVTHVHAAHAKYTVNVPALGHRPMSMFGKGIVGPYGQVVRAELVRALTPEESNQTA
jgi:hypothetical protein